MVIGFDWYKTLVFPFSAEPLPGAVAALQALPPGTQTFVATHFGGLAYRVLLGQLQYPTAQELIVQFEEGLAALGWRPDLVIACVHPGNPGDDWQAAADGVARELGQGLFSVVPGVAGPVLVTADPAWRKPAPIMLQHAAAQLQADPATIAYVGSTTTDLAAAHDAGMRFIWMTEFLEGAQNGADELALPGEPTL